MDIKLLRPLRLPGFCVEAAGKVASPCPPFPSECFQGAPHGVALSTSTSRFSARAEGLRAPHGEALWSKPGERQPGPGILRWGGADEGAGRALEATLAQSQRQATPAPRRAASWHPAAAGSASASPPAAAPARGLFPLRREEIKDGARPQPEGWALGRHARGAARCWGHRRALRDVVWDSVLVSHLPLLALLAAAA